jgi:hypothetical protein
MRLLGASKRHAGALRQFYERGFSWYTPRRIAEIFATELPNNQHVRHQELFRGLELAGAEYLSS